MSTALLLCTLNYYFSVLVSFDPTSYTVTEGDDEFAALRLVRSGDTSGTTVVTVNPVPGSAIGKPSSIHRSST